MLVAAHGQWGISSYFRFCFPKEGRSQHTGFDSVSVETIEEAETTMKDRSQQTHNQQHTTKPMGAFSCMEERSAKA